MLNSTTGSNDNDICAIYCLASVMQKGTLGHIEKSVEPDQLLRL